MKVMCIINGPWALLRYKTLIVRNVFGFVKKRFLHKYIKYENGPAFGEVCTVLEVVTEDGETGYSLDGYSMTSEGKRALYNIIQFVKCSDIDEAEMVRERQQIKNLN